MLCIWLTVYMLIILCVCYMLVFLARYLNFLRPKRPSACRTSRESRSTSCRSRRGLRRSSASWWPPSGPSASWASARGWGTPTWRPNSSRILPAGRRTPRCTETCPDWWRRWWDRRLSSGPGSVSKELMVIEDPVSERAPSLFRCNRGMRANPFGPSPFGTASFKGQTTQSILFITKPSSVNRGTRYGGKWMESSSLGRPWSRTDSTLSLKQPYINRCVKTVTHL